MQTNDKKLFAFNACYSFFNYHKLIGFKSYSIRERRKKHEILLFLQKKINKIILNKMSEMKRKPQE